jgi:hypothetical protein
VESFINQLDSGSRRTLLPIYFGNLFGISSNSLTGMLAGNGISYYNIGDILLHQI